MRMCFRITEQGSRPGLGVQGGIPLEGRAGESFRVGESLPLAGCEVWEPLWRCMDQEGKRGCQPREKQAKRDLSWKIRGLSWGSLAEETNLTAL